MEIKKTTKWIHELKSIKDFEQYEAELETLHKYGEISADTFCELNDLLQIKWAKLN